MKLDFESEVKVLQDLIKIDSVQAPATATAPFGEGTARALDYTLKLLGDLGFTTKNGDNYYGYGEVGDGEPFGILTHLDVVPTDGVWHYPPFGAVIDNGRLYGRGTYDDKGPTIACIFACARLLAEGYKPKRKIRFILGLNEESGWGCIEKYMQNEEMPYEGISPDSDFPVINCEKGILHVTITLDKPDGLDYIKCGSRVNIVPDLAVASMDYNKLTESLVKANGMDVRVEGDKMIVTATGKSAHGARPQDGDNALTKLLGGLGIRFGICNRLYDLLNNYDGSGVGIDFADEVSGSLTMSADVARTEGKKLAFDVDIRCPISFTKEQVLDKLAEALPDAQINYTFQKPLYVAKDDPLVVALLNAYSKVTGVENPEPIAIGGGTYARAIPHGVAFGCAFPGKDAKMHEPDEYIEVEDLKVATDIYYEALKALCFEEK